MTDLLSTLPDFSTAEYTHLLPSFEKNGITVADLLTLDPIEIVKRCPLPLLDVRRFVKDVIRALQEDTGIRDVQTTTSDEFFARQEQEEVNGPVQAFRQNMSNWTAISTLDDTLDKAIGGGVPTGYVTEVTGERY
jgi:DNA repair protein RAD57